MTPAGLGLDVVPADLELIGDRDGTRSAGHGVASRIPCFESWMRLRPRRRMPHRGTVSCESSWLGGISAAIVRRRVVLHGLQPPCAPRFELLSRFVWVSVGRDYDVHVIRAGIDRVESPVPNPAMVLRDRWSVLFDIAGGAVRASRSARDLSHARTALRVRRAGSGAVASPARYCDPYTLVRRQPRSVVSAELSEIGARLLAIGQVAATCVFGRPRFRQSPRDDAPLLTGRSPAVGPVRSSRGEGMTSRGTLGPKAKRRDDVAVQSLDGASSSMTADSVRAALTRIDSCRRDVRSPTWRSIISKAGRAAIGPLARGRAASLRLDRPAC